MTDNEVTNLGGKLGSRFAKLTSDAVVYSKLRLSEHQAGLAQKVLADFTNHVSDEVRGVMSPVWQAFAEAPQTPDEIRVLFRALATERGQAWAWIGGTATGAAAGGSLSGLFNNILAPVVQDITAEFPNGLLSPESVAAALARGLGPDLKDIALVDEAARGGLSASRLRYLIELARTWPTVDELRVLFNRKEITSAEFSKVLTRLGFPDEWRKHVRSLAESDFSLADISAMWNRSIVTDSEAIQLGSRVGFNEGQVRKSLELGGEPLPPEALGEAFRRGFIDSARFNRGIVQGPIRNEWFDVLERLQFGRMSTVDAADAVNQGHMDLTEGKRIAHENGLVPADFETLILTAGAPPGIDFATEALNRGLIGEAQFREMFLESRIKNKYLPLLLAMRTRIIPQETVRLLYRNGVYSREKTLQTLMWHGFTPGDATALLELEDVRQDDATKELTRAQIIDLYEEQFFDSATTSGLLTGLGFSEENAGLMMALADVRRVRKFREAAITRIRSAYVAGKIDDSEASGQMDRLFVPSDQRDSLLSIWDIDRTTVTKTLTASQIRQAFKKDLLSEADAIGRLTDQGYDQLDASLFLQLTA